MELSFYLEYLSNTLGVSQAARILGEAGFKYINWEYFTQTAFDWKKTIDPMLSAFQKYGLEPHQIHAPFSPFCKCDDMREHQAALLESVNAAAYADSEYLVIHADKFDFDRLPFSPQAALQFNYDYFAPTVEAATQKGVKLAFENTFCDLEGYYHYGSKTEDLLSLIEKFNCDTVCCCWDFGHGAVAYGASQPQAIAAMGDKIKCTHVHDNYLSSDAHLIPFFGKIDWSSCISALKKNSSAKVLSFELVYGDMHLDFAPEMAAMLYKIGQKLIAI